MKVKEKIEFYFSNKLKKVLSYWLKKKSLILLSQNFEYLSNLQIKGLSKNFSVVMQNNNLFSLFYALT